MRSYELERLFLCIRFFSHINQTEAKRRTIHIFVHTLNVFVVVVVVALVLVCDLLLSNTQSDFSFALGHTFNVYTNTDNVVRNARA